MFYEKRVEKEIESEYKTLDRLIDRRDHYQRQIDRKMDRIYQLENLATQLYESAPDFAIHAEVERVLYHHDN